MDFLEEEIDVYCRWMSDLDGTASPTMHNWQYIRRWCTCCCSGENKISKSDCLWSALKIPRQGYSHHGGQGLF
jgi:hypothetical protein